MAEFVGSRTRKKSFLFIFPFPPSLPFLSPCAKFSADQPPTSETPIKRFFFFLPSSTMSTLIAIFWPAASGANKTLHFRSRTDCFLKKIYLLLFYFGILSFIPVQHEVPASGSISMIEPHACSHTYDRLEQRRRRRRRRQQQISPLKTKKDKRVIYGKSTLLCNCTPR